MPCLRRQIKHPPGIKTPHDHHARQLAKLGLPQLPLQLLQLLWATLVDWTRMHAALDPRVMNMAVGRCYVPAPARPIAEFSNGPQVQNSMNDANFI